MKPFVWGALLTALVGGVFAMLWNVTRAPVEAPVRTSPRGAVHDDDLARRHRELELRVRELERELSGLREAVRTSFTIAAAGESTLDTAGFLDKYAQSFANGGAGSEYFRLAVDAHAEFFVDRMLALVLDPGQPQELRVELIGILGTERFRGDQRVVDGLLGLMKPDTPHEIAKPALAALAATADATAIPLLERYIDTTAWTNLPYETFDTIAKLAGGDRNAALRRLLGRAQDDTARTMVLDRIDRNDPVGALALFTDIWKLEQPVRLAAAARLGKFRTEEFKRFVDDVLRVESDPAVRKQLEKAKVRQNTVPAYDPMQAAGPPDAQPNRDDPKAWATKQGDMGLQWIDLTYRPARRAHALRIYEVNVAGAVAEVQTVDTGGRRRTVWSGADPTTRPGVFEVRFSPTTYQVARVRIILDTERRTGWNEIDAVELVGPDGRAWANAATASSTYAD